MLRLFLFNIRARWIEYKRKPDYMYLNNVIDSVGKWGL